MRSRACGSSMCTRRCARAGSNFIRVHLTVPWTLISRFREIIRGGCVISFLVISWSTRRGMPRIYYISSRIPVGIACVYRATYIHRYASMRVLFILQGRRRFALIISQIAKKYTHASISINRLKIIKKLKIINVNKMKDKNGNGAPLERQ